MKLWKFIFNWRETHKEMLSDELKYNNLLTRYNYVKLHPGIHLFKWIIVLVSLGVYFTPMSNHLASK